MTTVLEGGAWSAARPGHTLLPEKTRYPLHRRLGGPHGRSGQVRKYLAPTGIRSPYSQTRSQSLYQLNIVCLFLISYWLNKGFMESDMYIKRRLTLFTCQWPCLETVVFKQLSPYINTSQHSVLSKIWKIFIRPKECIYENVLIRRTKIIFYLNNIYGMVFITGRLFHISGVNCMFVGINDYFRGWRNTYLRLSFATASEHSSSARSYSKHPSYLHISAFYIRLCRKSCATS
jgi:hypothetical protein